MKNLAPQIYRKRIIFEGFYARKNLITPESLKKYLTGLSEVLGMNIAYGPIVDNFTEQYAPDKHGAFEAFVIWAESGAQLYTWERKAQFFSVDMYSCKPYSTEKVVAFTKDWFECTEYDFMVIPEGKT